MNMSDIFPGGVPQSSIYCMVCSRHFMMCHCQGLAHGEGMYFALPPVPNTMPLDLRLKRWAIIMSVHPLMNRVNAHRFLEDQGPQFCARLKHAEPIIRRLMEEYKQSEQFDKVGGKLGTGAENRDQILQDCDLALKNFFGGLWGQIKLFEWCMLNNAVQMSGPEDFTGEDSLAVTAAFEGINMVLSITKEFTKGHQRALDFQIEDVL